MNKTKKLALGLGTIATAIAPIAAVVSCGDEDKFEYTTKDLEKMGLVTDGGSITDKSFNQQGKEALDEVFKVINGNNTGATNSDVFTPGGHDAATITQQYKAAYTAGKRAILAPGFYHVDAVKKYNEEVGKNMGFIVADSSSFDKNVAGIIYKTKYSGFQAGVLAGEYLKAMGDTNPKVGTFGGGNFPGVTDFMVGFVKGIEYFNNHNGASDHDVTFYKFGTDAAYTNSGFASGGGSTKAQAMVAANTDIILPVAGPQTADAIAAIKGGSTDSQKKAKVIGVDTNQKLSYAADSSYFLTSIMKNVKDSMINVWKKLHGETVQNGDWIKGYGETTVGDLDNEMTAIEKTATGNVSGATSTTTWASLYAKADTAEVKAAAAAIDGVTWAQALDIVKKA